MPTIIEPGEYLPLAAVGLLLTPEIIDMAKVRIWLKNNPAVLEDFGYTADDELTDTGAIAALIEAGPGELGSVACYASLAGQFFPDDTHSLQMAIELPIGSMADLERDELTRHTCVYEFKQNEWPWHVAPYSSKTDAVAEAVRVLGPWLRDGVDLAEHVGIIHGVTEE